MGVGTVPPAGCLAPMDWRRLQVAGWMGDWSLARLEAWNLDPPSSGLLAPVSSVDSSNSFENLLRGYLGCGRHAAGGAHDATGTLRALYTCTRANHFCQMAGQARPARRINPSRQLGPAPSARSIARVSSAFGTLGSGLRVPLRMRHSTVA
jgi:hypothetical protein